MRKTLTGLLLLVIAGSLLFAFRIYSKEPLYNSHSYVFGTLVDISIYGETEDRARTLSNQVLQDFQQLNNQLHAWKPVSSHQPSALGALNAAFASGRQPITISPQLAAMLTDATALSVKSQGLFNPAIGHLISSWGFQRDEFTAIKIDDAKITALVKANPRMTDIVVANNTAYSNNRQVRLDLGGYAKGYALDLAANYLRKQNVKNALINIGGNIIAIGQHGSKPWRVGIQHPRKPAAIATLDLADGWAIGTSGDYQRYFMLDGKRYCHIIDPRNGYRQQFIIGMDLGGTGKKHFYADGSNPSPDFLKDYEPYIRVCFEQARRASLQKGFDIYNLSKESTLPGEIIPKISIEEALQLAKK